MSGGPLAGPGESAMQATAPVLENTDPKPSPWFRSLRGPSWPRWLLAGVLLLIFAGVCSLRLVSAMPLFAAAALGLLALALRRLYSWRARRRWKILIFALGPAAVLADVAVRTHLRYHTAEVMDVAVREY